MSGAAGASPEPLLPFYLGRLWLAAEGAGPRLDAGTAAPPPSPRLVVTEPRPGTAVDAGAVVCGFVEPAVDLSGPAELFVDGIYVAGAIHPADGAFAVHVPAPPEVRGGDPWALEVEVLYPDGTRLSTAVRLNDASSGGPRRDAARASRKARPGERSTFEHAGARLDIAPGALDREVTLTMEPLDEVAALDAGMTNVTSSHAGYRLGPDGQRFREPVEITLPFDPGAVPEGMSLDDVVTFFFDEEAGRWVELERVGVDLAARTVTSLTDHFSDFINATLTLPDHPSGTSFSPNSITDLELGDPGAGIQLIEPPGASPGGDAELALPLDLPPGRRGMTPQLTLTYSSRGGNGWLGPGWDLSASAIEVDTTFGVPRYDGTETYVLDGAELAPAPEGGGRWVRRVEGSFQRILRRGGGPDSYWWEVTDQDGTLSIYGDDDAAGLRDYEDPHNVFRWHLRQVIDVHGNTIDYAYATDRGSNGEPWVETYLASVAYTGKNGAGGYYRIDFVRDACTERPDKLSSGRSGFKVYSRCRLDHVDVLAGGALVRRYLFEYVEGAFAKTLLAAVAVRGPDGESELARHAFTYFPAEPGFAAAVKWPGLHEDDDLVESRTASGGGHGFVGLGPSTLPECAAHGGVQAGVAYGESWEPVTFVDLDGDGLTDRLADDGSFDHNTFSVSEGGSGSFDTTDFSGPGLSFQHGSELTWDLGLGGPGPHEIASFSSNWVRSYARDDRLLVDGDGRPDLVSAAGGFRFYHNKGQGFATEATLGKDFTLEGLDLVDDQDLSEALEHYRRADTLLMLALPYSGRIIIDGEIHKVEAEGTDGVDARIFYDNSLIWNRRFEADDVSSCVPNEEYGCGGAIQLDVSAGEHLYFLTDAVSETAGDALSWAPRVTYVDHDPAVTEAHGAPLYVFDAAADFRLAGPPGGAWRAPVRGTVWIGGALVKQTTADHVVATVVRGRERADGEFYEEEISRRFLAADETGSFDDLPAVDVEVGDYLFLRLSSDSQVDPDRVRWTPEVTYEGGTYCRPPLREGDAEVCGTVTCPKPGTDDQCELPGDPYPQVPLLLAEVRQPTQALTDVHSFNDLGPFASWTPAEGSTYTIDVLWQPPPDPIGETRPDPIATATFVDGLGRVIQAQADAELDLGTGSSTRLGRTVSGRLVFDEMGRVAAEGQPVFRAGAALAFADDVELRHPTRYVYDVLDRVRVAEFPHGGETRLDYGFAALDGVRRLTRTRTDAEGVVTGFYLDVGGSVVAVEQENTIAGVRRKLLTRYAYNPLDELVAVTDADGHVTSVELDTLGRRVAIDNPDAGRLEYLYELGGDLGARVTPNLRAAGQAIRYRYTHHRLDRVDYPEMTDVVYTWGAPGAPFNRAHRLATVSDESGLEELFYGKLGETVKSVKTATALNGYSPKGPYVTQYEYDSLGRLLEVTYPDGEVVSYGFDAGGQVKSVSGALRGVRYDYVTHLGYDEFGDRARIVYGNGVETRFAYDEKMRWLARLTSVERGGRQFQNLGYDYDKVGIIHRIENDVPVPRPSQLGGPTAESFVYDDLYQLVGAEGSYRYPPKKRSEYTLAMAYGATGNILRKTQVHTLVQPSGKAKVQKKTSYDWVYDYAGSQPHAATHFGERTFSYDANGNQVGWEHDRNGTRRTVVWDEENRIKAVADNGRTTRFLYGAGGMRSNKAGPHGETIYVNEYFSVRNGAIGSKHIFVDGKRVVTKVAQPALPGSPGRPGPVEGKRYFYHPDHLGSTHFVTDADGDLK